MEHTRSSVGGLGGRGVWSGPAGTPGWGLSGRQDETLSCLTSGGQSGDGRGSLCVTRLEFSPKIMDTGRTGFRKCCSVLRRIAVSAVLTDVFC